MRWTHKVFIQKTLTYFPAAIGDGIYFFLQRHFGRLNKSHAEEKLEQAEHLLKALRQINETLRGKKCLEIGSGWVPVIPFLFWTAGMEACYLYDRTPHLYGPLTVEAVKQVFEFAENRPGIVTVSENRRKEMMKISGAELKLPELLSAMNLIYRAPADVRSTGLPAGSLDCVFSNTTLEHVPGADIREIFKESARVLKPGGLMLHLIDLSDHFSHQDSRISFLNFLRYSEKEFEDYNNKYCYQNRLRPENYRSFFEEAGFQIEYWVPELKEAFRKELPRVPRDAAFSHLTDDDLLTHSICVAARKK